MGNVPRHATPTPSPPPSSISGVALPTATSLSTKISALYPGRAKSHRVPTQTLRILPLPLTVPAAVADARQPVRGFLVVVPPFIIAVDSHGEPDARHAILDVPQTLQDTPLGGQAVLILDAAVAADKVLVLVPSWLLMCAPSLRAHASLLRHFAHPAVQAHTDMVAVQCDALTGQACEHSCEKLTPMARVQIRVVQPGGRSAERMPAEVAARTVCPPLAG